MLESLLITGFGAPSQAKLPIKDQITYLKEKETFTFI